MEQRGQFTFYRSFFEAIRHLEPSDRDAAVMAICDYALNGNENELSGVPAAVFSLVKPNLDNSRKKAENGKAGGKASQTQSTPEANGKQTASKRENKRENKNKKEIEIEINKERNADKPPRFVPPSVDDVRSYCQERGNGVDPQAFVDFYTSKGWKVGKSTMKDWKASVRTWERRDGEKTREGGMSTGSAKNANAKDWGLSAIEL